MKRYHVTTFGCQMNEHDSERMAGMLDQLGYRRVDAREDAEMLAEQTRKGDGRENVKSVLLGRGASDDKVDHWLREAAPVEGFIGFAIGRSIWWDPLKAYVDGKIERSAGAAKIAENYLRFVEVYEGQTVH